MDETGLPSQEEVLQEVLEVPLDGIRMLSFLCNVAEKRGKEWVSWVWFCAGCRFVTMTLPHNDENAKQADMIASAVSVALAKWFPSGVPMEEFLSDVETLCNFVVHVREVVEDSDAGMNLANMETVGGVQ